jgi:5'(3')-deoxyribonucleotidase
MDKKPTYTILVDLDAIVADLMTDWLALYNAARPNRKPVVPEDVTSWNIGKAIGDKSIDGFLNAPGLYPNLKPMSGAIEALKQITRMKWNTTGGLVYDVVFLTSAISSPHILADKSAWLRQHFPFIGPKNHMYGYKKALVRGDFFIDDAPKNLQAWMAAIPDGLTVTITYPYNKDTEVDFRAGSYTDMEGTWGKIRDFFATYRRVAEEEMATEKEGATLQ